MITYSKAFANTVHEHLTVLSLASFTSTPSPHLFQYLDLTNSALLVSPRYKYNVPVNILITLTGSFFFTLGRAVLIALLGFVGGGNSGSSSPPLARVDPRVPIELAFAALFFFGCLASSKVTMRDLRLLVLELFDSSLLHFLLDSAEEPDPVRRVPEPREPLRVAAKAREELCCGESLRLSSVLLEAVVRVEDLSCLGLSSASSSINRPRAFSGTSSVFVARKRPRATSQVPRADFLTSLPLAVDPLRLNYKLMWCDVDC